MARPTPRPRSYASDAVRVKAGRAQGLDAVVVGAPAEHQPVAQLEGPGHLVDPRFAAILLPPPEPPDQRHGGAAAGRLVLVELLELDCLLHPARRPRGPDPR